MGERYLLSRAGRPIPLRQSIAIGSHLTRQKPARPEKLPLIAEFEAPFAFNLNPEISR
jgi:hypothetical protein